MRVHDDSAGADAAELREHRLLIENNHARPRLRGDGRENGVLCLDPPEVKNYAVASEISWNQWSISGGTHRLAVSGRCERIHTPKMWL